MMIRQKALFAITAIFIVVYVVAYDRWRHTEIIGWVLSSMSLNASEKLSEKELLRTERQVDFPKGFPIGVSSSAYQIEGKYWPKK